MPIAETLDQWLDDAVKKHMERRGRKGNKCNTGEGDDPLRDEVAALYTLPGLDEELTPYLCPTWGQQAGGALGSADRQAITKNMLDRSMDVVKARMESGKRVSTDSASTLSRKNRVLHIDIGSGSNESAEESALWEWVIESSCRRFLPFSMWRAAPRYYVVRYRYVVRMVRTSTTVRYKGAQQYLTPC